MANSYAAQGVLTLGDIADYRIDVRLSILAFFRDASAGLLARYAGLSREELRVLESARLEETDAQCALTVLAAVEAAFRIDYQIRCESKLKDPLSRKFRDLYRKYQMRVSLEDDIFEIWKDESRETKSLIGNLKGAFNYRHWLAHGRYWVPKWGRDYDFQTVFILADAIFTSLDLKSRD
jgi:hypothetical protein